MALDQATTALLEQLAARGGPPLHELTVQQARGVLALLRGDEAPGPEMASVRAARVRVTGGFVPVRVLVPHGNPRGVIVYYHGGGFVIGGLDDFDKIGRLLAQRTGCTVLLIDYRLAPEYRFPTAVDDAWAALRWADEHRAELTGAGLAGPEPAGTAPAGTAPAGTAPAGPGPAGAGVPLIVAGDSAGGNLSAVIAQRAKAAGGPAITLQVLVYPATDADLETTSYRDPANQLMLTREWVSWFLDHYIPDPAARLHPDFAPLRAASLAGLPPAVVVTAEHDVLRDEGELYATRLLKAGVPVRHRRFAGQMHGFFTMVDVLPGAGEALDYVTAAVNERLAAAGASEPAAVGG